MKIYILMAISTSILFLHYILSEYRLLPSRLMGEGFGAGYYFLYYHFFLSMILIIGLTIYIKENKFKSFFTAIFIVLISVIINFVLISYVSHYKVKQAVEAERQYEEKQIKRLN